MLIFFFFNWQLTSKVGIESPFKIKVTCGLLGIVMERRSRGSRVLTPHEAKINLTFIVFFEIYF